MLREEMSKCMQEAKAPALPDSRLKPLTSEKTCICNILIGDMIS